MLGREAEAAERDGLQRLRLRDIGAGHGALEGRLRGGC